jgi:hypothetical protein
MGVDILVVEVKRRPKRRLSVVGLRERDRERRRRRSPGAFVFIFASHFTPFSKARQGGGRASFFNFFDELIWVK